jgi:tetratricopeptide (TPR) repeat protein
VTADPLARAYALMGEGRHEQAAALSGPLAERPDASHAALAAHAAALKGLGRRTEALRFDEQAIARFATSGVAWHNHAATLADLGRGAAAKASCERAFSLGLDGAETWGVYARALLAHGEHDAAERAYRETLARSPGDVRVACEWANIVWMRRGDLEEAGAVLDACFAAGGAFGPLIRARAAMIEAGGDPVRAADLLAKAAGRAPGDIDLLLAAAHGALTTDRLGEAERLLALAEQAAPDAASVLIHGVIIDLAAGRAEAALAKARAGLERRPQDQALWGWAATAARAAGDPLHRALHDFEAMVGVYDIETPQGWPDLAAFLADLAAALTKLHVYRQHPAEQSLRQGSQTLHLLTGSDDPAIAAFFRQVDGPIRQYMARVGQGEGPLRSRNTGDYRIDGAWSVRLRPGGFHRDHFHPQGWLSSAFYVETPDTALARENREGWIRFGQPPYPTRPALPAEHFVRPRPGRLVLFPSYMWHGTVPFTTDESRMTIAFDVQPA